MNGKYQVFISAGSMDFPFAAEVFALLDQAQIPAYFLCAEHSRRGTIQFCRVNHQRA
jgi:hypothetical protein